jgi:hypothetical protein
MKFGSPRSLKQLASLVACMLAIAVSALPARADTVVISAKFVCSTSVLKPASTDLKTPEAKQ